MSAPVMNLRGPHIITGTDAYRPRDRYGQAVVHRDWFRRLGRPHPLLVDGLVALTAAGLALAQMHGYPDAQDRSALNIALVLSATLPLVWRRRAPFTVFAIGASCSTIQYFMDVNSPLFAFLAFSLSFYTLAAYGDRRRAFLGAAIAAWMMAWSLVALVVAQWPLVVIADLYDVLDDSVLLAGAWIMGVGIRRRRIHAAALEERAAHLEREREEKARQAVTQERLRIARELHDVVAHGLSVIGVQAGAARLVWDSEPGRARDAVAAIEATANRAMGEMRRALGLLRDTEETGAALAPPPGLRELPSLLDQVRNAGLAVDLTVEGCQRTLTTSLDLSLYRIVQEALTNALKHADATRAHVVIRYDEHAVEVEVTDNGRALPQTASDGTGTIGMRERVGLFGGDLQMGFRPQGGYALRARLPTSPHRP